MSSYTLKVNGLELKSVPEVYDVVVPVLFVIDIEEIDTPLEIKYAPLKFLKKKAP